MSGLMEILVIVAVILGIIVLPRILRKPEPETRTLNRSLKITGWERLAILVSILWLSFFTLYLRPWNKEWAIFFYVGVGPIVLSWGIFWIFLGFKKKNR